MQAVRLSAIVWIVVGWLAIAGMSAGANLTGNKQMAEAQPDKALVYLIREKRFTGGGRTMFVFADQTFLGTLDNDSYTYAYLSPGKHLLWLNWAQLNTTIELEAGKTYYYTIWMTFDPLDEKSGKAFIDGVSAYATPTPRETDKAAEMASKRYGKAVASAAKRPDDRTRATSLQRRAAHIAKWPKTDLSAYSTLCVEPFVMADPKAKQAKQQYLVESAPDRIADLVLDELGPEVFTDVRRETNCGNAADTVVMRTRITQYKLGSEFARLMIAGAGNVQIEMIVELVSAESGQTLAQFEPKGTWAWGGALGASKSMPDLEKNVAYEVAGYLKVSRGQSLPD